MIELEWDHLTAEMMSMQSPPLLTPHLWFQQLSQQDELLGDVTVATSVSSACKSDSDRVCHLKAGGHYKSASPNCAVCLQSADFTLIK